MQHQNLNSMPRVAERGRRRRETRGSLRKNYFQCAGHSGNVRLLWVLAGCRSAFPFCFHLVMLSLAPRASSSSLLLLDPFRELREKCFSIPFICFSYFSVCVMTVVLPLSAGRFVMSLFCFFIQIFSRLLLPFLVILLGGGLAVFRIPAISLYRAAFCPCPGVFFHMLILLLVWSPRMGCFFFWCDGKVEPSW